MQAMSMGFLKQTSNKSGNDACCVSSMRTFADAAAAHGKFCHIKSNINMQLCRQPICFELFPLELCMHITST